MKKNLHRGYAAVGLDNNKNPLNAGHVLRAADCYGASLVVISGNRYRKAPTDTSKAFRNIPLLQVDDILNAIPYDCVPVAVELVEGARSLVEYTHPDRAFYIFGAEDNTLGKRVLEKCRDVVYIPTRNCMNLSACVNTVLYDRMYKSANRKFN